MIILKSEIELAKMRNSGRLVYLTHQELQRYIEPGISTRELDHVAENFIRKQGAIASFKGYNGFPGSICASVNEELVHGIPGKRILQEGDVISIDIGVYESGYHGDSAWTYPVGKVSPAITRFLEVSEASLYKAIEQVKPGGRIGDISYAVQSFVEGANFSVVRDYVGHGIGQSLHEAPSIPNYGVPGKGPRLKPGMTLAIEPMINFGRYHVRTLGDNWTVVSDDGLPCAHFEHTVAVTDKGYEIFTIA